MNIKLPRFAIPIWIVWIGLAIPDPAIASPQTTLPPYFQNHCVGCHGQDGESGLNLLELNSDLQNDQTFRNWVRVYDRIESGEMPPASEKRPAIEDTNQVLAKLRPKLLTANQKKQQTNGRVNGRRLTRTEYENLLNDLLGIQAELSNLIPAGASSGFDVIASRQGISPQHIQGYFDAADRAIDLAIRLDPDNENGAGLKHFDYKQHKEIRKHIDKPEGHVIIGETDNAVIMFTDAAYLFKVPEFSAPRHGSYRMRALVESYQARKPVVFTLNFGDYKRGMVQIIKAVDLEPGVPQTVEADFTLDAGQYLFPGVVNLDIQPDGKGIWNIGPDKYQGEGVAIQWIEVEGPIDDAWPPKSTTDLLGDIQTEKLPHVHWDAQRMRHFLYIVKAGENPKAQMESLVNRVAPRAFRRPLLPGEMEPFVELGMAAYQTAINDSKGRINPSSPPMDRAVRVTLRAILTAPQTLYLTMQPGKLDDHSLAARIALFLWKSKPDEELLHLARSGKLSESQELHRQIERMLGDSRSQRMVVDFANQWLRLSEIEATAPDKQLYPEYDLLLKTAMLNETYWFLRHLIDQDLSSDELINSSFTFVNRRLAEHYQIPNVFGQEMRLVQLPPSSHRGGLLTQASILKVTANGTTTSPVRRGSWVLTNLLGQPPAPPPPNAGSVEPDTRGATTIRDLLDKHRRDAICASCHKTIDPPGFALESFDVIGGFRQRYRSVGQGDPVPDTQKHLGRNVWEYKLGPVVDSSGTTATGESFRNIDQFKEMLRKHRERVAQNLIHQMLTYATGEEIQFADREVVLEILAKCREKNFGLRTIIHEIVQSRLFLNN